MVARNTPSGIKLGDGYQAFHAFAVDDSISLWEKTVTPPGFDGGERVDTTTMYNETVRTYHSRYLIDISGAKMQCAYDPKVYNQITAIVNVNGLISTHFPDGSRLDWYGYLQKAQPSALAEGEFPMMDVEIVSTNVDGSGNEVVPHYYPSGSAES